MESSLKLPKLLALLAGLLVGCSENAQLDVASGVTGAPEPVATSQPETGAVSSSMAAPSGTWSGAVGSWCGPAESQTFWLSTGPGHAACEVASHDVYSARGAAPGEGLTLALDAQSLSGSPRTLDVAARYCSADGACRDGRAALDVTRFAPGVGLQGAWAFTAANDFTASGILDVGWCNWDDYLPAHPDVERLARDIAIREIAVYQGVKVSLARDGVAIAPRNADLVQQRPALVRVFVAPGAAFEPRALSARVTLQNPGESPRFYEHTLTVHGPSTDADGSSTFNLELPKDAFGPATEYAVELRETARCTPLTGAAQGARFPAQGLAPVLARQTGPLKVMLVPVRYLADGSGRLPDTSATQLEQMSRRLYSMYPTTEVMISVRDAVGTERLTLGDMLDQVRELRASDAPASDLSYYGMVRQAETFGDYCQSTCTTGIAGFGSMNGTTGAGMGIGFPGAAANTFVHELGHIYRRPHAPCGEPSAPDESYPYPNAGLGSWGYDLQTHELFEPTTHVDFMSYCSPDWISDYSYQQILERIVLVNQRAGLRISGDLTPRTFRTLRVLHDGTARWGLDLSVRLAPPGDRTSIRALGIDGKPVEIEAYIEEGPEGETSYFVPAGHTEWRFIQAPGAPALDYAAASENKPFQR